MFGFYNINKPAGPTSHDLVARVRRLMPDDMRVGHAGTLDPFAEGVLVICVGQATRLATYLQAQTKRYLAQIILGKTSTTDDPDGEIRLVPTAWPPDKADVQKAVRFFIGEVMQAPPAYSAVHVEGKRAYHLARMGAALSLPPKKVDIYCIDILRYEYPVLDIDVVCGSGTYIRSLARDIGALLKTGAYCGKLTRTKSGPFTIEKAKPLEAIDLKTDLVSPLAALDDMDRYVIPDADIQTLFHGGRVPYSGHVPNGEVAIINAKDDLLAIATLDDEGLNLQPSRVFVTQTF